MWKIWLYLIDGQELSAVFLHVPATGMGHCHHIFDSDSSLSVQQFLLLKVGDEKLGGWRFLLFPLAWKRLKLSQRPTPSSADPETIYLNVQDEVTATQTLVQNAHPHARSLRHNLCSAIVTYWPTVHTPPKRRQSLVFVSSWQNVESLNCAYPVSVGIH